MTFLTEDELKGFAQREELDAVLSRFLNIVTEKVLCSIPDMVVHLAKRTSMMQELYSDLFKVCPECQSDKELLASVIQGLEFANPGLPPASLFALVPDAFRKAKGLESQLSKVDFSALDKTVNGIL